MAVTPGTPTRRRSPRRRTVDAGRTEELIGRVHDIVLADGFSTVTMDDLAGRLGCSKATLYSLAGTKDQLVQVITRRFFRDAAAEIEAAVGRESDARSRIRTYLDGVGSAMRRHSPQFYTDMVGYGPTARIYRRNSEAAARRVHEMIDQGVADGSFRDVNGLFAANVVTVAIDALQSGVLLDGTGLSAGEAFSQLGDLVLDGLRR